MNRLVKAMVMKMRFKDEYDSLDVLEYFEGCVQKNIIYVKPGTFAL